jgi:4-amino-4-deoxy-L-arabinose transferase-like glycosyltransferase
MRQSLKHQFLIFGIAAVAFFSNLGATRLWDVDEPFFARTAVEMHQRNEWVVPYFNGEVFAHKPPFMYWMMRIGYLLFGVNEFAARFWSAVFGIFTAILVYRFGRKMFNAQVGLFAGLAIATAVDFEVVARAATPDCFLVFFSALALYLFARQENWAGNLKDLAADNFEPIPLRTCMAMYAAMAVAVLVKGPIGVLLPGGTIGLYLLMRDPMGQPIINDNWTDKLVAFLRRFNPVRILSAFWSMRPLTALATIAAIAGPWFVLVGKRTGGKFLGEFFGTQNIGRFVGAMDHHGGGIWYYIPAVLFGFFPWSIFGIPTVLNLSRQCKNTESWQRGSKFVACWIVVYTTFFSIAATKLPSYLLPIYPALALATACFIDRWLTQPQSINRWWPRLSFGSLLLVGVLAATALPVVAYGTFGGRSVLERIGVSSELAHELAFAGWIGVLLAIGGAICLLLCERDSRRGAIFVLSGTSLAFCMLLFAYMTVRLDRYQVNPTVAQTIRHSTLGEFRIAQYKYLPASLVYYTDARIDACNSPEKAIDYLKESTNSYLVTTDEQYGELKALLPADVQIIGRYARFPMRGSVVILSRKTSLARRSDGHAE